MHGDVMGLVYTVLLVCLCWTVGRFIKKKTPFGTMSKEFARKAVHIGVSNFAFLYLYCFEADFLPFLGLIGFALINWWIETHTGERRSWGTVEYPLSVAAMIVLKHLGIGDKMCVATSLLAMGYGDGLAAIIGKKVDGKRFPGAGDKTWAGFATVFVVVFLILAFFMDFPFYKTIICALCASLAEVYTPFGLDNVTVPLVVYFLEVLL